MPHVRPAGTATITSTYYDTPSLTLHRAGMTLRVRHSDQVPGRDTGFVQTVKVDHPADGDFLERGEWEEPISSGRPDPAAPETGRRLPSVVRQEGLRPVFTTIVKRDVIEMEPRPSTRLQIAIDDGKIRTNDGATEPIHEVELELKCGDPRALYDIALRLIRVAHLRIAIQSKAERGYRLGARLNAAPPPVHAKPLSLDPAMTVEETLQRFGRACLIQVIDNEPAVLADDAEGIHQMRVAIRRLRSALSTMKRIIPQEQRRQAAGELKWFTRALTPARNWDMFVNNLLPPVVGALADRGAVDVLVPAVHRHRREAIAEAKEAILSDHYTEATLRLLRWFAARAWRDQPVSETAALLVAPIGDVASDLLADCHRRARKRSKGFTELSPQERHRLRIALKRLRYTIEFLASLYGKRKLKSFLGPLRALQDDLGQANDVRTAHDLAAQFGKSPHQETHAVERAAGILLGWHEKSQADHERTLEKRVRRFRRLEGFW